MANIEKIKTDLNKENEGVWVDFAEGIRLKIARARNPKYQELLRSLLEPKRKDIRDDNVKIEDFNEILLEVRAKTILLDWENIEEDTDLHKGSVPYSSEKAKEYFENPELRDFYQFVVLISENAEQYKKDLTKASEKN